VNGGGHGAKQEKNEHPKAAGKFGEAETGVHVVTTIWTVVCFVNGWREFGGAKLYGWKGRMKCRRKVNVKGRKKLGIDGVSPDREGKWVASLFDSEDSRVGFF
jgi:hypothetical protein